MFFIQLRELLFTDKDSTHGCDSHLTANDNHAIKQLLLSVISLKVDKIDALSLMLNENTSFQLCSSYQSLLNLLQKTLLSLQAERLNINLENLLDECLQYLIDMKIIIRKDEKFDSYDDSEETTKQMIYETTKLGKATVEG